MDFKAIQDKLKLLRDRIRQKGEMTEADEDELKRLIHDTLYTANTELGDIQSKLEDISRESISQDNALNGDQRDKLDLIEKIGSGSTLIH